MTYGFIMILVENLMPPCAAIGGIMNNHQQADLLVHLVYSTTSSNKPIQDAQLLDSETSIVLAGSINASEAPSRS
jgi:hypothetical protein